LSNQREAEGIGQVWQNNNKSHKVFVVFLDTLQESKQIGKSK
jgi:hypothetical protein